MMGMFKASWKYTYEQVVQERLFMCNLLTLPLDASLMFWLDADVLANEKLWILVGPELVQFRENLLKEEVPRTSLS